MAENGQPGKPLTPEEKNKIVIQKFEEYYGDDDQYKNRNVPLKEKRRLVREYETKQNKIKKEIDAVYDQQIQENIRRDNEQKIIESIKEHNLKEKDYKINDQFNKVFGEGQQEQQPKLTNQNKLDLLELDKVYSDPNSPLYDNGARETDINKLYKEFDNMYGKDQHLNVVDKNNNVDVNLVNDLTIKGYNETVAEEEAKELIRIQKEHLGNKAPNISEETLVENMADTHMQDVMDKPLIEDPGFVKNPNGTISLNDKAKERVKRMALERAETNRLRNLSNSPAKLKKELKRYQRQHTSNKDDARKLYNELQSQVDAGAKPSELISIAKSSNVYIAGDQSIQRLGTNTQRQRNRSRAGAGSEDIMKAKKKSKSNEEITGGKVAKFIGNRIWDIAGGYVVRHQLKSGTKQQNALKQYKEQKEQFYGQQENVSKLQQRIQDLETQREKQIQTKQNQKEDILNRYREVVGSTEDLDDYDIKTKQIEDEVKQAGYDVDLNDTKSVEKWLNDNTPIKDDTFDPAELEKQRKEFDDVSKKVGRIDDDNGLYAEYKKQKEVQGNTKFKGRFKKQFQEIDQADVADRIKDIDLPSKITWKSIAASQLVGAVQISQLVGAQKQINISEDKGQQQRKALTGQKIERMYL